MELHDAALYFDDIEAFDGYTGQLAFLCQFSNFDDRAADGTTSKRRVLSIGPGVQIPTRRVLRLLGEYWIVGDGNSDAIFNETIRQAFSMKKANFFGSILTPAQAVNGALGHTAWAQAVYFRDQLDLQTSSDYTAFYNIFFADNEPVKQGAIIQLEGRLYRVRNTYKPLEGYVTAQSDELDEDALVDVVFSSRTYNPVMDDFLSTPSLAKCLRIDYTKSLRFLQESGQAQARGDEKAYFSTVDLPNLKVGDVFTMVGETWRIISALLEGDAWLCHIRRSAE